MIKNKLKYSRKRYKLIVFCYICNLCKDAHKTQCKNRNMHISIILSGGVGSRMQTDIPKQYVIVNEKPIISFCIETFLNDNNSSYPSNLFINYRQTSGSYEFKYYINKELD